MWLVEARTVFGRARVRVLLAALAAVPILLAVAVYLSGGPGAATGRHFWTGPRTTGCSPPWPGWR